MVNLKYLEYHKICSFRQIGDFWKFSLSDDVEPTLISVADVTLVFFI